VATGGAGSEQWTEVSSEAGGIRTDSTMAAAGGSRERERARKNRVAGVGDETFCDAGCGMKELVSGCESAGCS